MAIYPTGAGLSIALRATNSVKSAAQWSRGGAPPIYLWVPDNGRYTPGHDIVAEPGYFLIHGLTRHQVLGGDYDGVPWLTLRVHLVMNAHGAEACTDGTLLVTTTEALGDATPPGEVNANYHESVLVIDADKIRPSLTPQVIDLTTDDFVRVRCGELGGPPAFGFPAITHVGMRDVKQLHDGSIVLGRGPVFTRMSLDRLRNKIDLVNAPVQFSDGTRGESAGFDLLVDPENPEHVWQLSAEVGPAIWQWDLTNPTGASQMNRIGRGTNYDPGNWGGSTMAFDAEGNLWIPRSGGAAGAPFGTVGTPDIARFPRAGLNTLNDGDPQINLTPDRTVTSAALSALNLTREYIWGFAIRDGLMFVGTYDFGPLPRPYAKILIYDAAALAGGEHEPISVLNGLPTRALQLVFAPGVA